MDISVIIVSWNVEVLLKKCLTSIFEHTRDVAFEVIVVDNNSSDGSVAMVKHDFPGVRVIALDDNRGFAYANNAGMQAASGTHMLLLNPDTEFAENTLNKVFGRMEQDVRIGVLGCQLLNADRTIQPSVRRFPRARDILVMLLKLHKLFPSLLDRYLAKDFSAKGRPASGWDYSREQEVDQVMGAFFCIRGALVDALGPLDPGYFIWFEEVDFCRKIKKAGFKVVYWPGTSIIHHGGQSFGQVETFTKQWWFFRSALRYFLK